MKFVELLHHFVYKWVMSNRGEKTEAISHYHDNHAWINILKNTNYLQTISLSRNNENKKHITSYFVNAVNLRKIHPRMKINVIILRQ